MRSSCPSSTHGHLSSSWPAAAADAAASAAGTAAEAEAAAAAVEEEKEEEAGAAADDYKRVLVSFSGQESGLCGHALLDVLRAGMRSG